ncbi:MAG: hypothetical protein CSA23_02655 [Deltaproteobacteria bacterium]|nr:MAG: hypothetical protein CSA23_02655 [Deltaproteobacteria bacterium]
MANPNNISIYALLCGLIVLGTAMPVLTTATTKGITLAYDNEPLSSVFQRLSHASGLTIVVSGTDRDVPVSGMIDNLPLDEAIREILRPFNSTIVWDDRNKAIVISTYASSTDSTPTSSIHDNRSEPFDPQSSHDWFKQALKYSRMADEGADHPPGGISGADRQFIQGTPTTTN